MNNKKEYKGCFLCLEIYMSGMEIFEEDEFLKSIIERG
jgi:hypothetical protein